MSDTDTAPVETTGDPAYDAWRRGDRAAVVRYNALERAWKARQAARYARAAGKQSLALLYEADEFRARERAGAA